MVRVEVVAPEMSPPSVSAPAGPFQEYMAAGVYVPAVATGSTVQAKLASPPSCALTSTAAASRSLSCTVTASAPDAVEPMELVAVHSYAPPSFSPAAVMVR